jgi:hypothetical protein
MDPSIFPNVLQRLQRLSREIVDVMILISRDSLAVRKSPPRWSVLETELNATLGSLTALLESANLDRRPLEDIVRDAGMGVQTMLEEAFGAFDKVLSRITERAMVQQQAKGFRKLLTTFSELETIDLINIIQRYKTTFIILRELRYTSVKLFLNSLREHLRPAGSDVSISVDLRMQLLSSMDRLGLRKAVSNNWGLGMDIELHKLEWLCPSYIDPFPDHLENCFIRHQGTAEWIFKDPHFENWREGQGSFLWLTGTRMTSCISVDLTQ